MRAEFAYRLARLRERGTELKYGAQTECRYELQGRMHHVGTSEVSEKGVILSGLCDTSMAQRRMPRNVIVLRLWQQREMPAGTPDRRGQQPPHIIVLPAWNGEVHVVVLVVPDPCLPGECNAALGQLSPGLGRKQLGL